MGTSEGLGWKGAGGKTGGTSPTVLGPAGVLSESCDTFDTSRNPLALFRLCPRPELCV